MVPALLTPGKLAREAAVKAITDEVGKKLVEKFGAEKVTEFVLKDASITSRRKPFASLILDDGKRLDGRGFDDSSPDLLRSRHSATRARFGAFSPRRNPGRRPRHSRHHRRMRRNSIPTPAAKREKKFILHYNFPNFSVGETGRISGPGRREIGHGALAERSIEPMIPLKDFPYAIRITSEIMESNGSTSMASVCGGTLALDGCGCSDDSPVAGISIGICTEYGNDKTRSPATSCSPTSSAGKTRSATWIARSPAPKRASPVSNST